MMKPTKRNTILATAAGMVLASGMPAQAGDNPFVSERMDEGYRQSAAMAEGKCGGKMDEKKAAKKAEGKCGADHAKMHAGKCGGNMGDKKPAMGEGKCGGKMKGMEGKCGGGMKKEMMHKKPENKAKKGMEGKCGEGKCGGSMKSKG